MPSVPAATANIIRARLKEAGIDAKVRSWNVSKAHLGSVMVYTPTYAARFTPEEIKKICQIAIDLGMTFVYNTQINPDHEMRLTGKQQWEFFVTGETVKKVESA